MDIPDIPFLHNLPDADRRQLASHLEPRSYHAGEEIFRMGEPGDVVYFIESGQVVVFDPADPATAVRLFTAGGFFGELAAIDHQPRTLSARAESDCQLWALPAADFERLVLENKALVMEMLVRLTASIRYTTDIFRQAAQRSLHDALTGLYNRMLYESLVRVVEENHPPQVAVVMIDIDGLKQVNDARGHAAGDRLIQAVAEILRSTFRHEDAIARIGGDEFVVVLPNAADAGIEYVPERLRSRLEAYNQNHPQEPASFSFGIAQGPGEEIQSIIRQADAAMYAAKQARRQSFKDQ